MLRLDGRITAVSGARARTLDFHMQMALDDLHFRDVNGKALADIEIATAEKSESGDFAFRVERATLGRTNAEPGALAPYARRCALRPETSTVRVIVRDRLTGRYGTLDIPIADR